MNVYTKIDRLPPFKIANYITHSRKMSYKAWLYSPVSDCDSDWISNDGTYYTHEDFLYEFYNKLINVIRKCGYDIEDEKQFKNEFATFVYRLSRESE